MTAGGVGVETIAHTCPVKSASITPGCTKIPCKVALDLPISKALNFYPLDPCASKGTL